MLFEFETMWERHLDTITTAKHLIELVDPTTPLVRNTSYSAKRNAREFEKTEILMMLENSNVDPAQTKWTSPIIFATKKDDIPLCCVDYRKLNDITKQNLYSILWMDECINSLRQATILSTVSANSGDKQIRSDKPDWDKTVFTSQRELYRLNLIPFVLHNALGTF